MINSFAHKGGKRNNRKRTCKVRFASDVKKPTEAGILCTIDGEMFFSFTKNTWIRD